MYPHFAFICGGDLLWGTSSFLHLSIQYKIFKFQIGPFYFVKKVFWWFFWSEDKNHILCMAQIGINRRNRKWFLHSKALQKIRGLCSSLSFRRQKEKESDEKTSGKFILGPLFVDDLFSLVDVLNMNLFGIKLKWKNEEKYFE